MAVLSGLDERMLRDIGLTRNDVCDAIRQPLWRDPTAVLASRAGKVVQRRVQCGTPGCVEVSIMDKAGA
jgi:hypothetical protein